MLSLGQAARETQLSKATIHRAIKSGKLSATRLENGSYEIDPSELSRVYGSMKPAQLSEVRQNETANETLGTGGVAALKIRVAVLEAELAAERRRSVTAETDRDKWATQAERLALPHPIRNVGILARLFGRKAG